MAAAGTIGAVAVAEVAGIKGLVKVTIPWVSSSGGAVQETGVTLPGGTLVKMRTDPDGTAAPTDNYDITLLDGDGVDVLGGAGANRDTANVEDAYPAAGTYFRPVIEGGTYYPTIAAAGDTKAGEIELFIARGMVLP